MGEFNVDVKYTEDLAIFQTYGYINNLGGEKIEEHCDEVLRQGYRTFIINFNHSPIINSIGISCLIGLIDRVQKARGSVCFTNLTAPNSEVFDFMGLTKFAQIFKTEEDAIRHSLSNEQESGSMQ